MSDKENKSSSFKDPIKRSLTFFDFSNNALGMPYSANLPGGFLCIESGYTPDPPGSLSEELTKKEIKEQNKEIEECFKEPGEVGVKCR